MTLEDHYLKVAHLIVDEYQHSKVFIGGEVIGSEDNPKHPPFVVIQPFPIGCKQKGYCEIVENVAGMDVAIYEKSEQQSYIQASKFKEQFSFKKIDELNLGVIEVKSKPMRLKKELYETRLIIKTRA